MQIDYTPHPAQLLIHKARDARFRTVCTGRRFGKTLCMAAELLDRGGGEIGGDYGWVAPTYGVAERGVEAFRTIAPDFVRVVGRMPTRVEFEGAKGPCRVWMLSADNPDSIRGFGFREVLPVFLLNEALRTVTSARQCGKPDSAGLSGWTLTERVSARPWPLRWKSKKWRALPPFRRAPGHPAAY